MKKMTKRTLALAMSTGMLLSNSVWAADTDADPYGAMPETVTLHVGRSEDANASYLSGQDSLNNYLVDYIKEQLNVDFVYDFSVASDYSTKVSMAIASGSIPDIMFVTASVRSARALILKVKVLSAPVSGKHIANKTRVSAVR